MNHQVYLSFLNSLDLNIQVLKILDIRQHDSKAISGWKGINSLTCLSQDDELYDIDIRYAWDEKIFQQNLIDHGWNEKTLVQTKTKGKSNKHKIIIYICEASTKLTENKKQSKVLEHFLIGTYWKSVSHLYLLLPFDYPFEFEINKNQINNFLESYLLDYEPIIQNTENSQIKVQSRLPTHPKRKGEGGLRTKGLYKHSTSDKTLITVVTVVFNGEDFLEQTIQSVINQSYPNLEYIIIDGGSTDNTLGIIKEYEERIDYWVSEPDLGVFDAMNKAFICAYGEFVNFMNCGDIFFYSQVINSLNFENNQSSICGMNIFFSNSYSGLIYVKVNNKSIPHQALFMKRNDFNKYIFNTKFKYSADGEMWTRFNAINNIIKSQDEVISLSRFGGISTSKKYLFKRMQEHLEFEKNKLKVLIRFIPKIIMTILLSEKLAERLYFYLNKK